MPNTDHKGSLSAVHPELNQIITTRKIPNALLFTGPSGTGKTEAAFVFAMGVNCLDDTGPVPCGQCKSCKKISGNMHPDMIRVQPEEKKKNITIAQIRDMGMQISTRSNEARYRMVLIQQADVMNVQAQNALLKLLEEPPEHTFFILTATALSGLLDTILSRCRKFRFTPMTGPALADHLVSRYQVPQDRARLAAAVAGSDVDQARRLASAPQDKEDSPLDWEARRQWLITELLKLLQAKTRNAPLTALALSQRLSRDADAIQDAMAVMHSVFRDLRVMPYDAKKIVNLDFFSTFKDIIRVTEYQRILQWSDALYETEKRLMSNSSPRLTLDRFFLGFCMD